MADASGVETPVNVAFTRTQHPGILMYCPTPLDLWGELDAGVLRCLAERPGARTPTAIGCNLGMSEQADCSIIGMLAEMGKIQINSVERIV